MNTATATIMSNSTGYDRNVHSSDSEEVAEFALLDLVAVEQGVHAQRQDVYPFLGVIGEAVLLADGL